MGSGHETTFVHAAWDNLRIDVVGFTTFCEHFLEQYPGYYVVPLRMSGSAVETYSPDTNI